MASGRYDADQPAAVVVGDHGVEVRWMLFPGFGDRALVGATQQKMCAVIVECFVGIVVSTREGQAPNRRCRLARLHGMYAHTTARLHDGGMVQDDSGAGDAAGESASGCARRATHGAHPCTVRAPRSPIVSLSTSSNGTLRYPSSSPRMARVDTLRKAYPRYGWS